MEGTLVPTAQKYPAVHGEQTLAPDDENVPAGHGVVTPDLQKLPAGHAEQLLA